MANILDKLAEEVDKIKEQAPVPEVDKKKAKKAKKEITKIDEEEDSSPMGKLLAANPMKVLQVGDVVEGTVIDVSSNSLLLDLGAFGTGIVMGKEIKDGMAMGGKLKEGEKVSATLVDLENDEGLIELSIREASYEKSWDDLESKRDIQETVKTKVLDANKGGLMVELNGITGFLPVSQLSSEHYPRVEDGDKSKILSLLKKLVGQEINVRVISSDREAEKLIVSEKAAVSETEKQSISELKLEDVVEGEISGVVDFGAFIKFLPPSKKDSADEKDKLEGLIHISELAWQLIDDPRKVIKSGDVVKAKIIGIDDTRISLSIKALNKDPWSEIEKKYKVGDIVKGTVDKINPFGAFVYLDEDIHGLAHISEFQEAFPGKKIEEILKEGKEYNWKILSIESKSHRMGLILIKGDKKTAKKEEPKAEEKETEKPAKEKKTKKEVKEKLASASSDAKALADKKEKPAKTEKVKKEARVKKVEKKDKK